MPKSKSKALAAELAAAREQLNDQAQELASQQGKTLAAESASEDLQSQLRIQEAIGATAASFAATNASAISDARDYEIEVLKLEVRRMQDMMAVHDVTGLAAENVSLRREIAGLHAENLSLSQRATENTEAARRDVGQVQTMLETQYRRSLKDAEQRVKEQLYSEMSENQKDMVQRHRDLMASVNVMKTHNSLMEGRLEKTQMDYNESKIQADIASSMQDLQSKEIVVLRHRLNATQERARTLENILLTTYKAHPHLVDWALSATHDFGSTAGDMQSLVASGTAKASSTGAASTNGDSSQALAEAQAEAKRLRVQRDLWKTRAQRMKGVFAGMQHDLHVMTQIAQSALPDGGGFQEDKSIWSDAPATGSVDTYLEDAQALVIDGEEEGAQAPSLHTPAELEELDPDVQGLDATLRGPDDSCGAAVARRDDADQEAKRQSAAAISDINFMPKLTPVRTFVRTTAGKEEKPQPQPAATLEWKPKEPAKSAMKSGGLKKSGDQSTAKSTRKGVTLHESQNVTHALRGTQELPRGSSNAGDMKGTAKQLALDDDSAFSNVEHMPSLMECMAQGAAAAAAAAAPVVAVAAVPAVVGLGTTRRRGSVVRKSNRFSLMVDENTQQLIDGLTSEELLMDVNVPDHPPICFFAAKGDLDGFTHSPTVGMTPTFLRVERNPFSLTRRKSQIDTSDSKSTPVVSLFSAYDTDDSMPHVSRLRDAGTDEVTLVDPAAGHGDDDDAARDDLSNRLFGTAAPAGGAAAAYDNDDDNAREALSDRIFGSTPQTFDSLDEDAAREALSDRLFGGTPPALIHHDSVDYDEVVREALSDRLFGSQPAVAHHDSIDEEAAREALSDRLFGSAAPASYGYGNADKSDDAQEEVASQIFGATGRAKSKSNASAAAAESDEEQDERDALTERMFGSVAAAPAAVAGDEDREQARDALTQRMFGATVARTTADQDAAEADEREALTQRLFGDAAEAPSDDEEEEADEEDEAEEGEGDEGGDLFKRTFGATFAKLPLGKGGGVDTPTDLSDELSSHPTRLTMSNTMPASAKIPALYDADLVAFDESLHQMELAAGKIHLQTRRLSPMQGPSEAAWNQQTAPGAVPRSRSSPDHRYRGAILPSHKEQRSARRQKQLAMSKQQVNQHQPGLDRYRNAGPGAMFQ